MPTEAQDYRVYQTGNYVQDNYGNVFIWGPSSVLEKRGCDFCPVAITREWLVKMNFAPRFLYMGWSVSFYSRKKIIVQVEHSPHGQSFGAIWRCRIYHFSYVHELQNLNVEWYGDMLQ